MMNFNKGDKNLQGIQRFGEFSRAGHIKGSTPVDTDERGLVQIPGVLYIVKDARGSGVVYQDKDAQGSGLVKGRGLTDVDTKRRSVPVPVAGLGPSTWPLAKAPESEVEVDYGKIEFLMRAIRLGIEGCMDGDNYYHRNEFYKIRVEKKDNGDCELVAEQWCESQLNCLESCSMHRVGSHIYNISRLLSVDDVTELPRSLTFKPSTWHLSEELDCHRGFSSIDVNCHNKWNPEPPLECFGFNVEFAVLDGVIYYLQSCPIRLPRCYRIDERTWVECCAEPPRELLECLVTQKMIPQPSKKRILVHLTNLDFSKSYLYAWIPQPQHSWKLITQDISYGTWEAGHPQLVDDILYFYDHRCPPYFSAYDLNTNKWLTIKWSRQFPPDAAGYTLDFMFYLGQHLLCLVKSRCIDICDSDGNISNVWGARVTFSVFRFLPTSPHDGPLVIFTHLFTKSLACPDICEPADFISLVQDEVK